VAAAVFMVLGVYLLKSVVFVVPASLIYIAVGMAFDTKLALIVNCVGIMIEITATYIMGKILGKDAVTKKLSKTKAGEKLLNMQAKSQNLLIFTIRMSGLPIDFSSLFMGAFDFKFLPYFMFSLLGILPRVILFTIIGDRFYDLIPMKYIVTAVIIIIPLAAAYVIIKKIIDKKKAQSEENV
ncbi:MAG: VTT domain-containing protein, partial [Clostridia bacterium]|nr:VTT domain-containing protein [Clostridia bacterium]